MCDSGMHFQKEMLIDINNPEHKYNFSRLDSVLDFLVEHDIYPFIELENKPKRVEKTTSSSLLFELFEDITSLENWESILEVFFKTCGIPIWKRRSWTLEI